MNNALKNQRIGNQADRILDSMEYSIRLSMGVIKKDKKRAGLRKALFDDKNKSIIIPSFKAIEIIREVSRDYKKSKMTFFDLLHRRFDDINRDDPELGRLIDSVFVKQRLSPLIMRIRMMFLQYEKEKVFEHFKQHYRGYSTRLSELENKELATNVLNVVWRFLMTYGKRITQINSIQNFANNVRGWNGANGQINVYVEKARGYIEALRKINDKEINSFLTLDEIRHILTYQRELIFLKDVLRRVSIGEEESTWKDFLNVYDNMKKIIKALRVRYFDRKTAEKLEDGYYKKKYGQQPEKWKDEFKNIIGRLEEETKMIREFQAGLLNLFAKAIRRIKEGSETEFIGAKRSIIKVTGKIGGIPKKYKGVLLRAVKKKEKILDGRLASIREKYDVYESYSYRTTAKRFYGLLESLKNINPDSMIKNIRMIEAKKGPLYKRGVAIMSYIRGDDSNSFKMLSDNMLPLFAYENALESRLNKLKNEGQEAFYIRLPKLVVELRGTMPNFEKQLDKLINFLEKVVFEDKEKAGYVTQEVKRMAA